VCVCLPINSNGQNDLYSPNFGDYARWISPSLVISSVNKYLNFFLKFHPSRNLPLIILYETTVVGPRAMINIFNISCKSNSSFV